ncbi:MAG: SIMPL domain-containing protein [Solirubrobacterales bacterium]|nr:SIMPL domain-containing protein [Solirubrobacterales bacterium]
MTDTQPTVLVRGTARRELTPERARIALTVTSALHPNPELAMRDAADRRSSILNLVESRHPEAKVTDTDISAREETGRVERSRHEGAVQRTTTDWESKGYTACSTITVESSIEETTALIATGTSASRASSIEFSLTGETRYAVSRELDAEAVKDARRRAAAIAAAENLSVSSLLSAGEGPDNQWTDNTSRTLFERDSDSFTSDLESRLNEVRPHPITVTSSLPVRFALIPMSGQHPATKKPRN